ncbi:MAG: hypothetical protein JSV12_04135 [Candidatus Bathyarchaeota archaeon]|nr:MAG: hypothetical protein JSV12_04135 [Candidatus Bathyarchaeota archaeon]
MSLINDYQKGWALRYLREAEAELIAAQKTPYMASSLILEAVKKAQAAIYYSLGDPSSIETIVRQTIYKKRLIANPVLKCLVGIERTIHEVMQTSESKSEKAFKQADDLLRTAKDIVELFTGERTD